MLDLPSTRTSDRRERSIHPKRILKGIPVQSSRTSCGIAIPSARGRLD